MKRSSHDKGIVAERRRIARARVWLVWLLAVSGLVGVWGEGFARTGNTKAAAEASRGDKAPGGVAQSPELPQQRVFVRSKSLLVRAAVVEDKLLKRAEFKQLGFVLTRDAADADLILELRHDLLTKYVFSVVDVKTQTVVASGKVSSLGGTVGGKVAQRFVKDMARARTP